MDIVKHKPFIASILSLLIPGLGQICAGKSERGAAILIAVIIVGNLNAIWLTVFALSANTSATFYGYTLPRLLHDIFAFYGIIFWIWQVVDAYCIAKKATSVVI
jgi:TM2 domain-containing membrane protein YozV